MTVQITITTKGGTILFPNQDFIKSVPASNRKTWHDALVSCPHGQTQCFMLRANQFGKSMCCLMVGHEAFGGDDTTRDAETPLASSPFTTAMCDVPNPNIAENKWGKIDAAECNDTHDLTFEQIAKLVYPEAYTDL